MHHRTDRLHVEVKINIYHMTKDSPSEAELLKLIDELKIRQTDLETQNRELTKQISGYNLTALTNTENESKLFNLADNLPGFIAFVNATTLKYEYVNKSYQNSFGIPIEKIVGRHVREVIGEPNFQFALKYIEMVKEGKSASYENTFNLVSGKRWISVNYAPYFDKDKNVSSIIVLTYDITDRKKAEELLKVSEEKYRFMFDNNPQPMFIYDPDTLAFLEVNKNAIKHYGYSKEEFLSMTIKDIRPPEDIPDLLKEIEHTRHIYNPFGEWRHIKKNGDIIYVNITANSVLHNGKNARHVLVHDITERKKTSEMLQENDYRLRKTQEIAHLGSWELDINTGLLIWSDEVYTIFGCQTNEFGGTMEAFFEMVHPEDRDLINSAYFRSVEANAPGYMIEHRIIRKSTGEIRFVFEKCEHIRNGEGKVIRSLGMVQDITDRKKAEQILKENETKLLQLNAEKDKFFSIIAHDLRSPFNVFLGFTQMMVEELDTMPIKDLQKITMSMRNSATNLFQLLENLLDWSRFQRGLLNFNRELLFLKPKITESIQLSIDSASKKGVKIEVNIPENIEVFADSNMIGSVIRNLTSNAVKFTPKGGKISIEACQTSDNFVEVSVIDSGVGMNEDIIDNLFRLDDKTSRRGTDGEPSTGLGLIICKDFVEKNGGKIWALSKVDKGSTFKFTIPASVTQV